MAGVGKLRPTEQKSEVIIHFLDKSKSINVQKS